MARAVHLNNAPIVEAVVELQVSLPSGTTSATPDGVREELAAEFPRSEKLRSGTFQFQIGKASEPPSSMASSEDVGTRFTSEDGRRIVDFGLKAFTFHWLAPYTEWKDLRTTSQRLWDVYVRAMQPMAITRMGVRFINRLSVPSSAKDLGEYLVPGPVVPPGLPQSIQSFLSRIEIVDVANRRLGIIVEAVEGLMEDGKNLSVLLDVDAIKTDSLLPGDTGIWEIADGLRAFKNDLFFNSVTDLLLDQYR